MDDTMAKAKKELKCISKQLLAWAKKYGKESVNIFASTDCVNAFIDTKDPDYEALHVFISPLGGDEDEA